MKTTVFVAAAVMFGLGTGVAAPKKPTVIKAASVTCTNGPSEALPITFEDGMLGGSRDPRVTTGDYERVLTKPLEVATRGTGKALAASVEFGGGTKKDQILWISVPICKSGGTADLRGKTVSAKLRIEGPAVAAKMGAGMLLPNGWGRIVEKDAVALGTDLTLSGTVPTNDGGGKVSEIILGVALGASAPTSWTGTFYWDDISVE